MDSSLFFGKTTKFWFLMSVLNTAHLCTGKLQSPCWSGRRRSDPLALGIRCPWTFWPHHNWGNRDRIKIHSIRIMSWAYWTQQTLNTPVVFAAHNEQNLARFHVIEGCIDFPHTSWQTKGGKFFRIATNTVVSTEGPHFTSCRQKIFEPKLTVKRKNLKWSDRKNTYL